MKTLTLLTICSLLTTSTSLHAQLTGAGDQLLVLGELSGQLRGVPDGTFGADGMVAGDLDCDGKDDLVVQQPSSLVNTDGGANFIAGGQVTVIRSNGGNFPQPGVSSFLHQDIAGIPGVVETGDGFGRTASIFNLDGVACDDLFIGVPGEDVSGDNNVGTVHGFLGVPNVGPSTAREGVFNGAAANEAFGSSLTARVVSGIGRLYVGVPGASPGGTNAAGQIAQFGFSTDGQFLEALARFQVAGALSANDRWSTQIAANKNGGVLAIRSPSLSNTALARSQDTALPVTTLQRIPAANGLMAFGDFDGNGIDELAQQFEFGGLRVWRRVSAAVDALFGVQQDAPLLASGVEFIAFNSMAVGNFNGDRFDDLALGFPGNDFAGFSGRVVVIYGSATGLVVSNLQIIRQGEDGINGTSNPIDRFGASLATGDFNGDNVSDLAVGVPGELRGAQEVGGVHIIFGTLGPLIHANGFE